MTGVLATSGVFTLDEHLVIQAWDAFMASATGIPESVAVGARLDALYPELVERGLLPRLRRVAEGRGVEVLAPALHRYLIPCAPRDRTSRFDRMRQHVTISPVMSGDMVAGVRVVIEDVTPRFDRSARLSADLDNADYSIRLRAVTELAPEGDAPTVLSSALGDESWRVRRVAAEGLADVAGREAVSTLIEAVRKHHQDPGLLNAAITALVRSVSDVLPDIVPLLSSDEADLRTYAALVLGLLDDTRAAAPLLSALRDADANVVFHAIEALGRIGAREATDALADIANSGDFFLAFAALDALAAIGDATAASRVLPLLDDPQLAASAARALGAVGTEDVVAPLAALLARADVPTAEVAQALADMRVRVSGDVVPGIARGVVTPDGARALLAATRTAGDDELLGMATVLSWLNVDGVDEILASLLQRDALRDEVAVLLSARGIVAAATLAPFLAHENSAVRRAAADALGRIGSAESAPPLVEAVAEEDEPSVLLAIAGSLGAIGDGRAFHALLALTEHDDAAVRQAAVAALNSLGEPEMERLICERLESSVALVRESAVRVVGSFGYASCLVQMIDLCSDPEPTVRRATAEALSIFDEPSASAAIVGLVKSDPDATVRSAAVRALAELRGEDTMNALVEAFRDPSPWVRYYAARAAARRGESSPPLAAALAAAVAGEQAAPARIAAIEALPHVDARAAVVILSELSHDANPEIAVPAIAALGFCSPDTTARIIVDALDGGDSARQHAALDAAGRQGDGAAHAVHEIGLVARSSANEDVRGHAIRTLGAIGAVAALRELASLGATRRLRGQVASVLEDASADRLPALEQALANSDDVARELIVDAIGRIGDTAGSRLLAACLDDPSPRVRAAAARGLRHLDLAVAGRASERV